MRDAEGTVVDLPLRRWVEQLRTLSAQPMEHRAALNAAAAALEAQDQRITEQDQRITELEGLVSALLHDGDS